MKKLALFALLALFVAPLASSAAWISQRNADDDSALIANLNMSRRTNIQVYNNANVELNSNVINTTSGGVIAGDDAEDNNVITGGIESNETHNTSVNDVLIANNCGCDDASSGVGAVVQDNLPGGNDSTFLAEVSDDNQTDLQTANNLNYVENLNEANLSAGGVAAADDAERNDVTTGGVKRTRMFTRNLGTVTVTNGPVTVL